MAKKKLDFSVIDIEDTRMTGNRAYDLTRPRKGFVVDFTAIASASSEYDLVFRNFYKTEVENSVDYILKNKAVMLYSDFQRLFEPTFLNMTNSGRRQKLLLSNFPTLRMLYKKINSAVFLLSTNNTFGQSNFFEFYLRTGNIKRDNFTIICGDKYIPVINKQLFLNSNEDNKILYFDNDKSLLFFIKRQIFKKYEKIERDHRTNRIIYNSDKQFGFDYYMTYFNRIDFDDYFYLAPGQKLSITNEYEDNTTNTEVYDLVDPDDLLEIIDTSFYLTDAHFVKHVNSFNIRRILNSRILYKWEEPYDNILLTEDEVETFKHYFFRHICDTYIPDEKQVYEIKQIF